LSREGEELWKKHCSFLYEDFPKQVAYNRRKMDEYFKMLKNTLLLESLRAKKAEKIKQVPVTTYDDYLFLKAFGERVRELETKTPKKEGETLVEYYTRIGRIAAEPLRNHLPGEFECFVKTSGTTGQGKWIVHTRLLRDIAADVAMTVLVMACSEREGDTTLRPGDTVLNIVAPVPYVSGWSLHYLQEIHKFKIYPPAQITDRISDIRRRMWMIMKEVDRMQEKIALLAAATSMLYLLVRYMTDRYSFYKDSFESSSIGLTKLYMFSKLIQTKLFWEPKDMKKILPVKGIICTGYDSKIYDKLFRRNFGVIPLNMYGSSEFGLPMYGTVENKYQLVLDLRVGYFEFLDIESGNILDIDELKKGRSYGLIGTPFGSSLVRYRIGDILKVEDLRDDGMPFFSFEGREGNYLDVYSYFRITENLAIRVMTKADLISSDKWCFAKLLDPKEHICVLMEKELEIDEETASERIFKILLEESEDFRNFVKDFRIRNPIDIIKVEYLKKGAFTRYSDLRFKMGTPYGQVKPPKIIPTEKMEIFESLRGI
jgi:phenylacetate-coenzyme A ligase PaaK-like adenylate-forming protein